MPCLFSVLLNAIKERDGKERRAQEAPKSTLALNQSSQAMNDAVGIDGSVSPIFLLFNNTRKHALVQSIISLQVSSRSFW